MGPVVRLHHADEIPTAVLENTERDEERSRVEGKVKVGDRRGTLESRFIAPEVSGSVRIHREREGSQERRQERQNLDRLVSARILSENFVTGDRKGECGEAQQRGRGAGAELGPSEPRRESEQQNCP